MYHALKNAEGTIKNGKSRETGNMDEQDETTKIKAKTQPIWANIHT